MTIGEVTAFLLYMTNISRHLNEMAGHWSALATVKGAMHKISRLIVEPARLNFDGKVTRNQQIDESERRLVSEQIDDLGLPQATENDEPTQIGGSVLVDNVKFSYPTKKNVQVLRGVTIDVKKSKVVALVGSSGCGKSSIISLVERFYDPDEGRVLYNDDDIRELENHWYHQT